MALIAIPFRSLRFRTAASDWGVVFMRNLPRNSEQDFWPRVSTSISGVLTQEATMHGIEGVTGSHNLQINPYVLAQNERELINLDPLESLLQLPGSRRHRRAAKPSSSSKTASCSTEPSIPISATSNRTSRSSPSTSATRCTFPNSGRSFLRMPTTSATPILLVYTRNIVHPEYGIRLTGKIGSTNLGFFAIDDREPGETYRAGRSALSPARQVRRGPHLTGSGKELERRPHLHRPGIRRRLESHWRPRLHRAHLNKSWTAIGQMVESSTMSPTNPGTAPTYSAGPASYLEIQRTGHSFNLDSIFKDYSTGFQTQLGFIPTTNLYSDQTHATYLWYPKKESVQSFGLDAVSASRMGPSGQSPVSLLHVLSLHDLSAPVR